MKKSLKELIDMYQGGKGTLYTDQTSTKDFVYNDPSVSIENIDGEITRAGDVVKSVLERGIELPPLIFWSVQDPENKIFYGEDEFNLHDGKQLFLSLYNFVENNVITRLRESRGLVGQSVKFSQLTPEQQNKILNYEFDIIVRQGTLRQEADSFYFINSISLPLTYYETLRGILYGKFFTEFESYINSLKLTWIKPIGRGEQVIWLLYMYLELLEDDKKLLQQLAMAQIGNIRNESFDPTYHDFDKKVQLYNDLCEIMGSDKNSQKLTGIADYIIFKKYDSEKILDYYWNGLANLNDIDKWKLKIHKQAIDNLCTKDIKCDYRRFFAEDIKRILYSKSPRCSRCGETNYSKLEVDHIIPWVEGGSTTLDNAQLLCKACNNKI